MVTDHAPRHVRLCVACAFTELGAGEADVARMRETLLVQDGSYFGRTFLAGRLMAMWLHDVDVVQFYDADGNMLRTTTLCAAAAEQKAA